MKKKAKAKSQSRTTSYNIMIEKKVLAEARELLDVPQLVRAALAAAIEKKECPVCHSVLPLKE